MFTYAFTRRMDMTSERGDLPGQGQVGEELFFGGGQRFRVLDVVIFEEQDESRFVGLLQVEVA